MPWQQNMFFKQGDVSVAFGMNIYLDAYGLFTTVRGGGGVPLHCPMYIAG